MKIIFKIEFKYANDYVLGRLLDFKENNDVKANQNLAVSSIKNILPSDALRTENNQRNDLFIFCLKNKIILEKLTVGKIFELI